MSASPKPLPPGTLVKGLLSGREGVVEPYTQRHQLFGGLFPVRFADNGQWVMCGCDDVSVIPIIDTEVA